MLEPFSPDVESVHGGRRLFLPAIRGENRCTKPLAHKLKRSWVASPAVYDRRAESPTPDGVNKSNCGAAQRHGSDCQAADRKAQPHRRTPQREGQPKRGSAERNQAARETTNGQRSDRDVPNGEEPPCDSRTHGGRIDTHTDVNKRPGSDTGSRSIFKSQNRPTLQAVAAHDPRRISADALAADSPLACGTESDRDSTIMNETIHG